ncbi:MAG: helix-turn-helix domain-containing protein [Methylococcales bacterium]|nr:helix-turn-helix domain-containing protein [Methylococcales bacterium]
MDKETEEFYEDLLQSVREMKNNRRAKETVIPVSRVLSARSKTGLTQAQFAVLLGVSVRTLQDWEQGRREPSGAAKTLLRIAEQHPEALRDLAA